MKIIDGDAFFPLKSWPKEMKLIFWKKSMKDKETFKLLLFLIGNGCSPDLIRRLIVLAQYWANSWQRAEKRAPQVDYVLNNVDQKRNRWFYFDIEYNRQLYLNGLPKRSLVGNHTRPVGTIKKKKKGEKKLQKPCIAHRREKSCRSTYLLGRHCTLQVKKNGSFRSHHMRKKYMTNK